jgi:hypothetical protein
MNGTGLALDFEDPFFGRVGARISSSTSQTLTCLSNAKLTKTGSASGAAGKKRKGEPGADPKDKKAPKGMAMEAAVALDRFRITSVARPKLSSVVIWLC